MITQVLQLTDDLDGTVGSEAAPVRTSAFAWRGATYEVDLTDAHEQELHDLLAPYIGAARTTKSARGARATGGSAGPEARLVREWAAAQGITVPPRGRIPGDVVKAYLAGHAADGSAL